MSDEIIKLDIHKPIGYKSIPAKQYDKNSRYITVEIYDNDIVRNIDENETVRLRCTKPSSKYIIEDAKNKSTNTARFLLTDDILSEYGTVRADIGIYKKSNTNNPEDDELVSSFLFYIEVERAGYDENAVISSTEALTLIDLIAEQRILNEHTIEINKQAQVLITQMQQIIDIHKAMEDSSSTKPTT
jgi:hypothetical protein